MSDFILSSTLLNETQNHDDFKVIWCGSYSYVSKELIHFIDRLDKYDTFETCDNDIKKIKTQRKVLLVLTSFFDHLAYFNDLPQIQSIYILGKNLKNVKYEKEKYTKLIHVFPDERALIERLRQDILLTYRNDLPISISYIQEMTNDQSLISLGKNMSLFLWNQLFTYYLVNSRDIDMKKLKQDMIEQCQLEYQNDPTELSKINEFDIHCTYENILDWYTRDSCIYRLTNKAFRTRNIDLMCKFRYFMILLYNKLQELSIKQRETNPSTVYRAQNMKKKELEMLRTQIGNLISTNAIMSTTRNPNVARIFLDVNAEVSVLFEIKIPSATNNIMCPFADISQFSSFPEEEEVLFFTNPVFRIDSVQAETNSTWIIKLTLTIEKVELIEQLMDGFKRLIQLSTQYSRMSQTTDDYKLFNRYHRFLTGNGFSLNDVAKLFKCISLDRLIGNSGNCVKAIDYYNQLLLDENFIDQPKFIVLYIIIGNNYFRLSQYDNALDYYTDVLSLLDDNHRLTAEVHNHIGDVYRTINDFQNALLSYKEALKILSSRPVPEKYMPEICRKIIDIYLKQNNYQDAMIYEDQVNQFDEFSKRESQSIKDETSLRYQEQFNIKVDSSKLQRAEMLFTNGLYLVKQSEFRRGLENLLQAEKLFKEYLPIYDRVVFKLIKLYEHAAVAYSCLDDNFNALVMWKKAIDIRTTFNYRSL